MLPDDFDYLVCLSNAAVSSAVSRSVDVIHDLNSTDMHQIPARATIVYIILAPMLSCPPNIHATISKPNTPILPQLSAPMMASVKAVLSITTIKNIPFRRRQSPFGMIVCGKRPVFIQFTLNEDIYGVESAGVVSVVSAVSGVIGAIDGT